MVRTLHVYTWIVKALAHPPCDDQWYGVSQATYGCHRWALGVITRQVGWDSSSSASCAWTASRISSESDAWLTVRASTTAPTMAAKLARACLRRVLADRPGTTCPKSSIKRLAASVSTARTVGPCRAASMLKAATTHPAPGLSRCFLER